MMKKMIVAPDSFKGSLDATQVCEIISAVASKYFPDTEIIQLPISDGGEGLVDALLSGCGGRKSGLPFMTHWAARFDLSTVF